MAPASYWCCSCNTCTDSVVATGSILLSTNQICSCRCRLPAISHPAPMRACHAIRGCAHCQPCSWVLTQGPDCRTTDQTQTPEAQEWSDGHALVWHCQAAHSGALQQLALLPVSSTTVMAWQCSVLQLCQIGFPSGGLNMAHWSCGQKTQATVVSI